MRLKTRSGSVVALLAWALLAVVLVGAIGAFAFRTQADNAQAASRQAQSQATAAVSALEEGQEATRLAENRLDSASQAAQQKAAEFADARFNCDVTNDAIVFDDVTWCAISAQRLTELGDAERDIVRFRTELQISEDELPKLEANVEAALDNENNTKAAAASAESLFSTSLIAWAALSGVLATVTVVSLAWRRRTPAAVPSEP